VGVRHNNRIARETLENPVRFNVNQSLKARINELEQTIKNLKSESFSDEFKLPLRSKEDEAKKTPTKFDEIVKLMEGREYFETDREAFEIESKARLAIAESFLSRKERVLS
ncbi:hypothetical protein HK100_001601, partial [Physocladia obscura]